MNHTPDCLQHHVPLPAVCCTCGSLAAAVADRTDRLLHTMTHPSITIVQLPDGQLEIQLNFNLADSAPGRESAAAAASLLVGIGLGLFPKVHVRQPPSRAQLEARRQELLALPLLDCAANREGDCDDPRCPQLRDNEPHTSGRHCPLDTRGDEP